MNKLENNLPNEGEKHISFNDLIDPERDVPEEYKRLINLQELRGSNSERFTDTAFGINWNKLLLSSKGADKQFAEQELQYLKDHLKGQAFIDLGGSYGLMKDLAQRIGAQIYINVDRSQDSKDQQPDPLRPTIVPLSEKEKDQTTIIKVTSDMLDFITRIKDGSANFVLNGIDLIIINDPAYHEALANELLRATKSRGIIFGAESHALKLIHRRFVEEGIKLKEHRLPPELPLGIREYIFEKP